MGRPLQISSRNATFQQWQALLTNRTKRQRQREFLVHGVRPISMAVDAGWTVRALLRDDRDRPSGWAEQLWAQVDAVHAVLTAKLMQELGEKSDGAPELIAVVEQPPDDLARIPDVADPLVTVFDRPSSPGNLGTLARSIDAFGGTALVVTGHAADPYDPKAVRASTGSIFGFPTVRAASQLPVLEWVQAQRARGVAARVVGLDEAATVDVRDASAELAGPLVLVVGNETSGMTSGWREACDLLLRIPMLGTASSLNAATAGAIVLYEAMRLRTPAR